MTTHPEYFKVGRNIELTRQFCHCTNIILEWILILFSSNKKHSTLNKNFILLIKNYLQITNPNKQRFY